MLHYWLLNANKIISSIIYNVFGCFGLQTAVVLAKLSSSPGVAMPLLLDLPILSSFKKFNPGHIWVIIQVTGS